jgi:hypothetical protein
VGQITPLLDQTLYFVYFMPSQVFFFPREDESIPKRGSGVQGGLAACVSEVVGFFSGCLLVPSVLLGAIGIQLDWLGKSTLLTADLGNPVATIRVARKENEMWM